MAEAEDIGAWIGKAPEKDAIVQNKGETNKAAKDSDSRFPAQSTPSTRSEEGVVEIPHRPAPADATTDDDDDVDELQRDSEDGNDAIEVDAPSAFTRHEKLVIDLPKLDEDEKEEFEHLPGHFHVRKVLVALPNHRYLVRLASGEIDLVERSELTSQLHNGKLALNEYNKLRFQRGALRPRQPPLLASGRINWQKLDYPDSEPDDEKPARKRRKTYAEEEVSDLEQDASSDDEFQDSDDVRPQGRRSTRLAPKRRSNYFQGEVRGLVSSDDERISRRRPGRPSEQAIKVQEMLSKNTRQLRAQRAVSSEERAEQDAAGSRRSERTRRQPRRSMRERHEDDLSSQSEKDQGPKVVATKEVFTKVPQTDPFRRRHQQECATCYHTGDNDLKGPLVFCQGCSNAYHKQCLGPRGSRDHLVTKVGDNLFVLQCRRCIGVARERDPSAPHYGRCTGCDKLGALSKPLRRRLTTRQEQIQREENGGVDPITITQPETLNNTENVMFRCATCNRAWHMHHLPNRKTAHSQPGDSDEEGLDQKTIAQRRFELFYRSWICKDCVENQQTVDAIVAWRPVDQESYIPGTTMDKLPESKKEYLLKWRNQSYLRCTWMAGTWVWGIVASAMRVSFNKKVENQLPRMTTKDAIPEEYHRVDIVFDVRYTSVVRNSSEGIDLARVKEVDTAYVKYKGLGYEDAIWEKPPSYSDTERFKDFKDAYEDFVRKRYMSIPPQSTLRRALVHARNQDFETKLIKKNQPTIMTGGQMMQYQLEGHNWLYYQWYRQHNAILADEMGLGKTIQLIALMATLIQEHKCWPFLVVVPNSTCPNWRREIKKWVPSIRTVCYYGSTASRKLTHDYELFPKDPDEGPDKKKKNEVKDIKAHVVITSYESIVEKHAAHSLLRVPWQGLIVDEGQRLKNDKNLVYEALAKYRFPFKVLMTGTPLQNNARELFNLLQFLDKEKHNAAQLEAKYAELTQENVAELHELLKPYFLRRTKVQVLTFLPPMSQIIIPVSMSALQRKVSKSIMSQNPQLMKSIFSRDGTVAVKERANLNNILMQLRKTLCHPFVYSRDIEDRSVDSDTSFKRLVEASSKLQLLSIMLPKLKERGHRVLMFSQFLDNLDIVEDFLDGLGMLHRRLDGTITALEKQKRIDEFNAPESPYFAFLLSTRAGGVGINLATADTVIILDPDFNPHQDIQALSRAHRIGQQNKVLVFQLMTRNSPEEKIMQIGKKKMALDHVLIEAMDQDDEAGIDLDSILRHGATALFDDDESAENDIVYNETSVDKLLDRSQIESTKTSDKQSAESQFSFARIWVNDKATLEEGMKDSEASGTNTPNPDIWDKILKERERAYEEEAARKAEELGRGKRRRGQVDYGEKREADVNDALGVDSSPVQKRNKGSDDEGSITFDDEDYQAIAPETDIEPSTAGEESETEMQIVTARPFKRVKVPTGQAPHFNGDLPASITTPSAANNFTDYTAIAIPPNHKCSACKEEHPMGWCRLKIAGVEHCGLCGLAHMGHGRTCPHLNDEKQVETLLLTLKESTESRELIDDAMKYLRVVRGDLVGQRRQRERRLAMEQERRALAARPTAHATPNGVKELPASSAATTRVIINTKPAAVNGPSGMNIGVNSGDAGPPQPQQSPRPTVYLASEAMSGARDLDLGTGLGPGTALNAPGSMSSGVQPVNAMSALPQEQGQAQGQEPVRPGVVEIS